MVMEAILVEENMVVLMMSVSDCKEREDHVCTSWFFCNS